MAAPHAFWKGYLKLSLVTCPVAMTPALTEGERVRFRTINRATGNPVASRYVDAGSGRPVPEDRLVMGYETGEREFVLLEEEELAAVRLESTRTIDIERFVPADTVPAIWRDRPHYLLPDDKVGEEAFAVIREGMEQTATAGLSRLVLYRRERRVLLEPRGRGVLLWTLRDPDQVRGDVDVPGRGKEPDVPADAVAVARRVIKERTRPWDPALLCDPVQERLQAIIAGKRRKGRKPRREKAPPPAPRAGNVVDIMEALRRSLAGERRRRD
ncbi:Ku protein [Stella sp.]|uniref:non-homologous end joining protein Ku n=1 Tax=Stella sp. TaxID=2912054 RepID=UPI0035AEC222